MKYIEGVPALTLSLSDESGWILYEDGYILFGRFDREGTSAERLGHWVNWFLEDYPTTELDVVTVMTRVLDAMAADIV